MKTYLWIMLYFFLTVNLASQSETLEESIVRSETITSVFQLKENEGIQFLQNLQTTNQTLTEVIWLTSEDIHLKEGTDLSVRYKLKPIEQPLKYVIDYNLFNENGEPITLPIWNRKGDLGILDSDKKNFEFFLQDILESGVYYGQTYRLEILCQLSGYGLNCNNPRPKFDWSLKKKWPIYVPIGIGTIMAITGVANRTSYQTDYNTYIDKWNNGSTKGEAQFFYDSAVTKQKRNTNLVYIGTGIVVVSSISLLIKYLKGHLPKLKIYDKYCKRTEIKKQKIGLEILPAQEGIGLTLQF